MTTELATIDHLPQMTIEQALASNLPARLFTKHQDLVILSQDLSKGMIPGMTGFQIQAFIGGDSPDRVTPYGICQQALREIGSRYDGLLSTRYDYEKKVAELKRHRANQMQIEEELEAPETVSKAWKRLQLEAKYDEAQAEIDNILRRLPSIELQFNDTFRQLQEFVEMWRSVRDQLDPNVSEYDYERIEWEAKVVIRYFKGRMGYIPIQMDNLFLNDALMLAVKLREFGFTDKLAIEVASQPTQELRWAKFKAVQVREQLTDPSDKIIPLDAQDQIPGFIAAERQHRAGHHLMKR